MIMDLLPLQISDSEDGSFHSNNTGVYHHGFDRKMLAGIAKEAGFENIHFETANIIEKSHANLWYLL